MIRNRVASGANPSGGNRSISLDDIDNDNDDDDDAIGCDENGAPLAISAIKGNKENKQTRCFNPLQRKNVRFIVILVFILFIIHRMVLFSAVHQANPPDQSFEEFHTPKNTTNKDAIPKSGTTDRYSVQKVTYSLPRNRKDYSTIETMVQSHFSKDERWYVACKHNNATKLTKSTRKSGGELGKYYNRACPNTRVHPDGVHWNPFQTKFHNCSVTSRINLEIKRDHFWEEWRIQTLDAHGVPKTIGGDNFYVVYSEYIDGTGEPNLGAGSQFLLPVAVAIPIDYYNGTYGLDFVSVPFLNNNSTSLSKHDDQQKQGTLSIHVISTCFIGELHPPLKDGWKTGGHTNVTWTIENVSRPYRIEDWYTDRYQPTQYWESVNSKKKVQKSLSEFDWVVFVGDSLMTHMLWDVRKKEYHAIASKMVNSGKIWEGPTQEDGSPAFLHIPLSRSTLQKYLEAIDPWIRGGLREESNATKKSASMKTAKKKALVLGSAAWDIVWPAEWQGPNFDNHLSALEDLLRLLRKTHPEVTLLWKLPYALHMQNANHEKCFTDPESASDNGICVGSLRYATKERFQKLYYRQKTFIKNKFAGDDKVRLLDFYEISYLSGSHWMLPDDPMYYAPEFNAAIFELLYK